MSKAATKATINANIKTNGNQEITGQILNSVLNTMVDDYGEQGELSELSDKVNTSVKADGHGEYNVIYPLMSTADIKGSKYRISIDNASSTISIYLMRSSSDYTLVKEIQNGEFDYTYESDGYLQLYGLSSFDYEITKLGLDTDVKDNSNNIVALQNIVLDSVKADGHGEYNVIYPLTSTADIKGSKYRISIDNASATISIYLMRNSSDYTLIKEIQNGEFIYTYDYDGYLQIYGLSSFDYKITKLGLEERFDILDNNASKDTLSIIGDSYSTFRGYVTPNENPSWYPYPETGNNVLNVEQTWWWKFAQEYNYRILQNNSYSGSTICYDSYGTEDESNKESCFISRMKNIGNPKLIIIFGGTNDYWNNCELGDYIYQNFSELDLYKFRPALAYMFDYLKRNHHNSKILFVRNDVFNDAYNDSISTICSHYGIPVVELEQITKVVDHPNVDGMVAIKNQVIDKMLAL